MNKNLKAPDTDFLFEAVLTLKSVDECYNFFEDLCTAAEIKEFSRRFGVAKMLSEKKSYTEIIAETGLSTAIISRVNTCLKYGAGGYVLALQRTKKE
jgi:TrpR-related protein YerC/YecD